MTARCLLLLPALLLLVACGEPQVATAPTQATGIPLVTQGDDITPETGPPADPTRNVLSGPGGLYTGVTNYTDCSGHTRLTNASAALDVCVRGRTYFVGHNPGVFSPLLHYAPGDVITFLNGAGQTDHFTVVTVRDWAYVNGVPPLSAGARAQFQTCINPSGSLDRVLDAR